MNAKQKTAARALKRALIECRNAGLGVYIWGDNGIFVCPQPQGFADPRWDSTPMRVCSDIGKPIDVALLHCDGGAGI